MEDEVLKKEDNWQKRVGRNQLSKDIINDIPTNRIFIIQISKLISIPLIRKNNYKKQMLPEFSFSFQINVVNTEKFHLSNGKNMWWSYHPCYAKYYLYYNKNKLT